MELVFKSLTIFSMLLESPGNSKSGFSLESFFDLSCFQKWIKIAQLIKELFVQNVSLFSLTKIVVNGALNLKISLSYGLST